MELNIPFRVRLVSDMQCWEVLPSDTGVVLRTRANVLRQKCPVPTLWNTWSKPDWHRMEAEHLAEDGLLSCFDGLCLDEEGCNFSAVEMTDEAPVSRLAPSRKLLHKVDVLADGREWVVVGALTWSRLPAKHVGNKSSVASFLYSHILQQVAIRLSEACFFKLLIAELRQTVMKQIKLDQLLMNAKSKRLIVMVRLDLVHWHLIVPFAAKWLEWDHFWLLELAVRVVISGSFGQRRDGGAQSSVCLFGSGCSRSALVRSVRGDLRGGMVEESRHRLDTCSDWCIWGGGRSYLSCWRRARG